MTEHKNIKGYVIGLIIGISLFSGIAYTSGDTISDLFEKVGIDWKFKGENIIDGTITSEQLGNNIVSTEKIENNSVTESKLSNDLGTKINESVKVTGDQTINGEVTFSNTVSGVTPTEDDHIVTKEYVDQRLSGVSLLPEFSSCGATTLDGYTFSETNHGDSVNPTKNVEITGGTQTVTQTYECNDGTFGSTGTEQVTGINCNTGYTESGNTCVSLPSNCSATTINGYSLNSSNHNQNQKSTKNNSITGGTQVLSQEFVCNDGNFVQTGGETVLSTTCNSGYTQSGNSCNYTFTCGNNITYGGFTYTTRFGPDGKCWTSTNMKHTPSEGNSFCYNDSTSNCNTSGRLYDWKAANDNSVCGVLGSGWSLPSDAQFTALTNAGATGWTGNRLSGIVSVLPGYYDIYGSGYVNLHGSGIRSTSTEYYFDYQFYTRALSNGNNSVLSNVLLKGGAYSVICINNDITQTYTYSWNTANRSFCSASCGGGYQTRNVTCRRNDGVIVSNNSLCTGTAPESSRPCNTQACPTPINGFCGSSNGSLGLSTPPTTNLCNSGTTTSVSTNSSNYTWSCMGINGGTTANCSAPRITYTYSWQALNWGSCSASCGGGTQTRSVTCRRNDGVTVADSFCSGTKPSTSKLCDNLACNLLPNDLYLAINYTNVSVSLVGNIVQNPTIGLSNCESIYEFTTTTNLGPELISGNSLCYNNINNNIYDSIKELPNFYLEPGFVYTENAFSYISLPGTNLVNGNLNSIYCTSQFWNYSSSSKFRSAMMCNPNLRTNTLNSNLSGVPYPYRKVSTSGSLINPSNSPLFTSRTNPNTCYRVDNHVISISNQGDEFTSSSNHLYKVSVVKCP